MYRRILAVMAYVIPTFPLGFAWHLTVFASYYKSLGVYRDDVAVPLGVLAMGVQGYIWGIVYEKLFAGEPIMRGATRFAVLAAPLAWSYMVIAVAAKHQMSSVGGYLLIETAFVAIHFIIVSPLIAVVYASPKHDLTVIAKPS